MIEIILKLLFIFITIMILIIKKQPIYIAASIGAILTWLFYDISIENGINAIIEACTSWSTIQLILVMYMITFLQKMMTQKNAINIAQKGLSSLFNNRWVNCVVAPIFIGMLPTPNAAFIAGDIVKASTSQYLENEDIAVATTYFRHVSESFMPTYGAIILGISLSGVGAGEFIVGMIPIVICIIASGCFWFLRGKVPMNTGNLPSKNKKKDIYNILFGLWPIISIILMVVVLKMKIYTSAFIVLILYLILNKFSFNELKQDFKNSFQFKLYLNTFAVMIFKEFLTISGAIHTLPDFFSLLPIPAFMVFMLIFFFGSMISSSQTIVGLCMPIAVTSITGVNLPLLCLLMGTTYAAMQISPTHICLTLTVEYFGISLYTLIKKTVPAILTTIIFCILYYLLWTMFFI